MGTYDWPVVVKKKSVFTYRVIFSGFFDFWLQVVGFEIKSLLWPLCLKRACSPMNWCYEWRLKFKTHNLPLNQAGKCASGCKEMQFKASEVWIYSHTRHGGNIFKNDEGSKLEATYYRGVRYSMVGIAAFDSQHSPSSSPDRNFDLTKSAGWYRIFTLLRYSALFIE